MKGFAKVQVYIKNMAEEGPCLENNLHQYIYLSNSRGNLKRTSDHSDYFRPDSAMNKNDIIKRGFDLFGRFTADDRPSHEYFHWTNYFPIDTYKVKFEFYHSKQNKIIESDEISFVVKNVSGDEIQSLFLVKNCFSKYDSTDQFNYSSLDKLIEEHPNSVYTDYTIRYILRKLNYKNDAFNMEIKKKYSTVLIEKYPESKYVLFAIGCLADYYKSKNQLNKLRDYLEEQKKYIKSEKTLRRINIIQKRIDAKEYDKL